MRSKSLFGLTGKFLWLINYITVDTMDKISEIYKNLFFACVLCVIYAAASWGIALFGF